MYNVEVQLRSDKIKGRGPFTMPGIRNISINSGRIILGNQHDQLYTFRPDEVISINVWPKKGE